METQKPRRRWFRFRLRTLLIMVTLLSVPLGWVGWELDQRRREKATIAWIEEMGGQVYFVSGSNGFPGATPTPTRSWWEKTKDKWFGEKVQAVILGFPQVRGLSPLAEFLHSTQVSDLSPLAELKHLRTLWLESSHVTEEQVEALRRALPNCEIRLRVPYTPFKLATSSLRTKPNWRLWSFD